MPYLNRLVGVIFNWQASWRNRKTCGIRRISNYPALGNIDNAESHNHIADIIESGQEAFQRRNDIYQTWA